MGNEEKIYSPITISEAKVKEQKLIYIKNIPIYFPYEPYEPQKLYMEKVISSLNKEGSVSALESPTGTGKTLCLLCAVLAWIKYNNKKISIYYCTRTVSQINNVLKELNKTCYKLNTSFVASRKHACIRFSKFQKKKIDNTQLHDVCENMRNQKQMTLNNVIIKKNIEEKITEGEATWGNKKEKEIKEKQHLLDYCIYYGENVLN